MFAVAFALSGLVGAAPAALGQETGAFTYFISFNYDYTSVELGEFTAVGGPVAGTITILESSGEPFVEGENGLIACLVYGKRHDERVDLEAPCTITVTSEDKWFMILLRDVGGITLGVAVEGRADILGGTGTYAGVTGSCTYTTEYLDDTWLVTSADCEWSKE